MQMWIVKSYRLFTVTLSTLFCRLFNNATRSLSVVRFDARIKARCRATHMELDE